MKTKFELESTSSSIRVHGAKAELEIIGKAKNQEKPYVSIVVDTNECCIPLFVKDKDLERLAVNILKALKSKRLKS